MSVFDVHIGLLGVPAENITFMGYTVKVRNETGSFRYTEWFRWQGDNCVADWDNTYAAELYDHTGETNNPITYGKYENKNVINATEHKAVRAELAEILRRRFKPSKPTSCPPPKRAPGPQPLPDNRLVQTFSSGYADHSLCGTETCMKSKGVGKYQETGLEGYMPGTGSDGTVQLYQYWCSDTHDNYVTTAADAPKGCAKPDDLNPVGLVFRHKPQMFGEAGTVALQVWAKPGDHVTTGNATLIARLKADGYTLVDPAIGFVLTTPPMAPFSMELF